MGHTKWSAIQEAKGQHRRVVYVDNEAWEAARAFASENLTSMSAVVRRGIMHITQRGADDLPGQLEALKDLRHEPAVGENILREKDEEIARLKRELATRPGIPLPRAETVSTSGTSFGRSRPAPKTARAKKS